MHKIGHSHEMTPGPETTGRTLHWASQYDFFTGLLGFGVNSRGTRRVIEAAGIKPGDKVLDVGCGTGNLTLTARKYAGASGSAAGIDASPEMIDIAAKKAQRANSDTIFSVGLIERIPYPDSTFHVVISCLMVHHLPDELKRRAFADVLRVLTPGGSFLIADFNRPSNPFLAHVALAVVGHGMMKTDISILPPMLAQAGFIGLEVEKNRSAFLAFVHARKPS